MKTYSLELLPLSKIYQSLVVNGFLEFDLARKG